MIDFLKGVGAIVLFLFALWCFSCAYGKWSENKR